MSLCFADVSLTAALKSTPSKSKWENLLPCAFYFFPILITTFLQSDQCHPLPSVSRGSEFGISPTAYRLFPHLCFTRQHVAAGESINCASHHKLDCTKRKDCCRRSQNHIVDQSSEGLLKAMELLCLTVLIHLLML